MDDAIGDTGPLLHLHEAGFLRALGIFTRLCIPPLVAEELASYQFDLSLLPQAGIALRVEAVAEDSWREAMQEPALPPIQPTDAQVFALARQNEFRHPVLTDDLALRRRLEAAGADVVGSVGLLVAAYKSGRLARSELDEAVDALFTHSTLHLSRAFRAYVHRLLAGLR